VLLGALYLYGKWSERRKRSPATEENELLRNGSGTVPDSDFEKGLPKASANKNGNIDDCVVRSLSLAESSKVPLTTHRTDSITPAPRQVRGNVVIRDEFNRLGSPELLQTSGSHLNWHTPGNLHRSLVTASPLPFVIRLSILFYAAGLFRPHNPTDKHTGPLHRALLILLNMNVYISPKRLAQQGDLSTDCGEVLPPLYLFFEPRPKLLTQYRIVAAWSTHARPRDKILAVEVLNLKGCSAIERGDNTHRGWVEGQANQKPVDSAFSRNRKMGDDRAEVALTVRVEVVPR